MSNKQHRTEVIRTIKAAMETEKDPAKKVEYAKQLARLLPRPRQARKPRKAETQPTPSNTKLSIIDRVTGSALDTLPDGEKVLNWLVCEVEKMQRERHRKLTSEEFKAEFTNLVDGLSARDRAAFESWKPGDVA